MHLSDLSPRATPAIRRLVVVALVAVLALVTGRQVLAGDGARVANEAGPAAPAALTSALDAPVGEAITGVLPLARRTGEHESLVAVPGALAAVAPVVPLPAWAGTPSVPVPSGLSASPLGSRAPPFGD